MSRPVKVLVTWIIETVTLLTFAYFGFGLTFTYPRSALVSVAIIGLLNAFVRPIIVKLTLPITAVTLGLFSLLINASMLLVAARLLPGLEIASWSWAIGISICLAIINTFVSYLLHINEDDSYYYGVIKKAAKHAPDAIKTDKPGFFYLEVDGLGHDVFQSVLKQGLMPHLAKFLKKNNYQILKWYTDLSPQTPSSQAGILHGNNNDIPAFRWYDRKLGKPITGSNPMDNPIVEAAHSDGQGLLSQNGYCVNNLFSGDAPQSTLTISTLTKKRSQKYSPLYYYFINPYNYAHTLASVVTEMFHEWRDARYAKKNHVEPSISHRGLEYMFMRAVMNVYLADISFAAVIGQVLSGRSSIYLTSAGYDDSAHYTGIQSPEAITTLKRLDGYIHHLLRAAEDAPRPYHFIFLSDHGQSNGPTFEKVYGYPLVDLVNRHLADNVIAAAINDRDESYGHTNKLLTEITHQFRPHHKKATAVGIEARELKQLAGEGNHGKLPPVLVMASGNLGIINFTDAKKRLTLEEITSRHPDLIPGLVAHAGISFVIVKSQTRGTVVMGKKGSYYLKTDQVEGINPLKDFGPHILKNVKRYDTFPNIADIVVNSYYNPKTREVYAFEDFIGSHGGAGGPQSEPFLAFPPSLPAPKGEILSAENIYKLLKSWQKIV